MTTNGKSKRRIKTIQRINRMLGQLNSLKTAVEEDRECEYLVTQAHTIEKALSSLMIYLVDSYLEYHTKALLLENPDNALRSIRRLFELSHR